MTVLRADYAPDGREHPGEFPYTRGISAEPGPWIMGQYAGFGTAAETNGRFRALLDAGVTGFSVALDLPTQMGLDSDDPAAAGEVGRVGVAIDSLADVETLMEGIPLERISQVRTTANSIGYIWAAMFVALAEQRGLDPNAFGMFIQNDVLKEYIARGTQIFPPGPSLRLSVDVLEYVARHLPRWVPLAVSGYHIRESGSDDVQEIAFTFANAVAYLDAAVARGVSIDAVAPTLFTFLSAGIELLPEVAKFRAARRVWAKLIHERYAARDPRSEQLRIFVFTAGSSLTAQQPLNNVVRTTVEAMAAALAGVQTMHVCAYDEAVGVPTEAAATLALRTQQIVAFETGLTETVDPFGGSYAMEALTSDMASRIADVLAQVEARGGALACIESGWFQSELAESAYRQARAVEAGLKPVIGVNRFATPSAPIAVFRGDPAGEQRQRDSLRAVRQRRSQEDVARCLDLVEGAARSGENVVPACVEAVTAYATVGEIV
ncbi:MAG: methylmalonyl-CoA mutase family protein, partial [Candidatus Limnocylindrales bacterium]|nr:methylmalonyl-CoA mutase family protein [Candidatus Limnocylindrales bacterium]